MNRDPLILLVVVRPLHLLTLLASLWMLLRGHNEPGGGFIGGLTSVSATILWAVAHGTAAARARMPLGDPLRLALFGLLCAALSGLPGWLAGEAYLTHRWTTLALGPVDLALSTVLLFDVGVYLAVWGALAGYALALLAVDEAEQGGRAP